MKVVYNITYVVDRNLVDQWRKWMTKKHLPRIMNTYCFISYRLHKLIGLPDENEPTYSVQLIARNKSDLQKYKSGFEAEHAQIVFHTFQERVLEFRTSMVVVDEGTI